VRKQWIAQHISPKSNNKHLRESRHCHRSISCSKLPMVSVVVDVDDDTSLFDPNFIPFNTSRNEDESITLDDTIVDVDDDDNPYK
jgi:hypothetical protein